jgi:predicted aspartyl protease
MIDATIAETSYEMIVDTGASITVITPKMRDALGVSARAGTEVKAQGANGLIENVRVIQVDDLKVGPRSYADVLAAVMPLDHLERDLGRPLSGILGRNFLELHRLDVDLSAGRLRLHPAEGPLPDFEAISVPTTQFAAGGLTRLEVEVAGVSMPAVFDLGAARSVINQHAATAVGRTGTATTSTAAEPLLGADGEAMPTQRIAVPMVSLGALELGPAGLYVADIGVFETLGLADGPAMIFGIDLIEDRRVILSYRDRTLRISTPPAPKATDPRTSTPANDG